MSEVTSHNNLDAKPAVMAAPKEADYPRVEVKKENGRMVEYHYIDKVTTVTREVESSRAKSAN